MVNLKGGLINTSQVTKGWLFGVIITVLTSFGFFFMFGALFLPEFALATGTGGALGTLLLFLLLPHLERGSKEEK